jgi:hypothetical protein
LKRFLSIFIPLVLATGFRIAWMLYTRLTFEDAFITFRFARNLANNQGFVYNIGHPIYGSTTPLFALLLSGWLRIFPDFVVFGASMFGLLAGVGSIFLVGKLFDEVQIEPSRLVPVIGVLVLSDKLWMHDMGGMETPLVVCAMMASYWMLVRHKLAWSGIFAGILLWVRIDGVFWIVILVLAAWVINRRTPYPFLIAAALVYLPWVIYALVTFGSPIPYTITAKIQAYYGSGDLPYWPNFLTMLRWLTPFSLPNLSESGLLVAALITCVISLIGVLACRRKPWLMVLSFFLVEEMLRLVLMGETYESRYFVPLYWALMLLFGLGAGEIWGKLSRRITLKILIGIICLAIYSFFSLFFSFRMAHLIKNTQDYQYDLSRKKIGLWLNENTPAWSTIFLEPLGYIGFYADRFMVDQVGLVTPRVVALKNAGTVSTFGMAIALDTDYVVLHCDDALNPPGPFLEHYSLVTEVNPLDFDPEQPYMEGLENASKEMIAKKVNPRTACYQVWKKY